MQQLPDGSRVVMVLPEDKYATKKVEQIKRIVDEDLGFVIEGLNALRDAKVMGVSVQQYLRNSSGQEKKGSVHLFQNSNHFDQHANKVC